VFTIADCINGFFELTGGVFIFMSILKLHKEKSVKGVSWLTTAFFASWGLWNLYYYPSLGQWASFIGGIGVVSANIIWLSQIIYYSRRSHVRLEE
jgi:hypothetical protein